jgi:YD repeat-containing protein
MWERFKTNALPKCTEVTGNPMVTAIGVKLQKINLGLSVGGHPIALNYNSSPILVPALRRFKEHVYPFWRLNIAPQLYRNVNGGNLFSAVRPDGSTFNFKEQGGNFILEGDVDARLVADGSNFLLFSYREGVIEQYDQGGRLLSVSARNGRQMTYTYSDISTPTDVASSPGMLIKVSDDLDGEVNFRYDAAGRLKSLVGRSAEDIVLLDYDDADRLAGVKFQDGKTNLLKYANPSYPRALSGILYEDGVSYSNYGYDGIGRAYLSVRKGVAGTSISFPSAATVSTTKTYTSTGVLKVHEWSVPLSVSVRSPNGNVSDQTFTSIGGFPRLSSSSQPAGSGCSAATKTQELDANGNVIQRDGFTGIRSCHAYDTERNLETSRVEGLANTAVCANVLPAASILPVGGRKTSVQWHPNWPIEVKVAEPRRLTTKVYNGQPDPFNNGVTASCAPSSATLPDGSAIVVLCKQVEQATTDANGASGLTSTVDSTVPSRIQQWTYNSSGQMLTAKDPLDNTTTYAYYTTTTADHTLGDLSTVTNAKHQVTTYTKYNLAGQWLEMKDANDVVTTRTADLRRRLTSATTSGATTSYDYWPTGLLKQVTFPDSSNVSYGYDDAHRLISITDSIGNKITYTLDNSGNRTGEAVKDPSGRLARALTRVPDALNRIQQVTGRE